MPTDSTTDEALAEALCAYRFWLTGLRAHYIAVEQGSPTSPVPPKVWAQMRLRLQRAQLAYLYPRPDQGGPRIHKRRGVR